MLTSEQVGQWADRLEDRLLDHERRADTRSVMLEQLAFLNGWVSQCVRAEALPAEALGPLWMALAGLHEAGRRVDLAMRS